MLCFGNTLLFNHGKMKKKVEISRVECNVSCAKKPPKLFQKCKILFLEAILGEKSQVHYPNSQKHPIVTNMEGLQSLPIALRKSTFLQHFNL